MKSFNLIHFTLFLIFCAQLAPVNTYSQTGMIMGIGEAVKFAQQELRNRNKKNSYAQGPLGSAGVPIIRSNSSGSDDGEKINLPEVSNQPQAKDCLEGSGCVVDNSSINEQLSAPSNVAAVSALGSFRDSISSKLTKDLLSTNNNGMILSSLSSTVTAWNSVSANSAAGFLGAFTIANGIGTQSLLAEQNALKAFDSAGSQGQILSESYRSCIASLVNQSNASGNRVSYIAAQDICLKGQNKASSSASVDATNINSTLSFATHTSHPLYAGVRSVLNSASKKWESKNISNANSGIVKEIKSESTRVIDPKSIRLSDLLFIPTSVNSMIGAFGAQSQQMNDTVSFLRHDFLRLFGDVEYGYQEGSNQNSPFMGIAVKKIKPTFTYKQAVADNQVKEFPDDLFGPNSSAGLGQFSVFKEHLVYQRILSLMAKLCRVNNDATATNADDVARVNMTNFWSPDSTFTNDKRATWDDLSSLSTSFGPFDIKFGQRLFLYITSYTEAKNGNLCDILDPTLVSAALVPATSGQLALGQGAMSVKRLVELKNNIDYPARQVMEDIDLLAKIISGDQVNSSVIAAAQMLGTISGGNFEDRARTIGVKIISDVAGNYDLMGRQQQYSDAYMKYVSLINGKISAKGK